MDYLQPTTSRTEVDDTSPSEITPLHTSSQENVSNVVVSSSSSSSPPHDDNNHGHTICLCSYRVLAFVGGIAMTFTALINPLLHFSIPGFIMSIYTFGFGILILVLESSHEQHPPQPLGNYYYSPLIPLKRWQTHLKLYVRLLDFTWGRAYLYMFVGFLMISNQHPTSRINVMVGSFMVMVGILTFVSSTNAATKLVELHAQIDSKRDLKRLFAQYDVNQDGRLNEQEFAALLCHNLDVDSSTITYHEIEACFNTMDENKDGTITYEELKHWWNGWGRKRLRRRVPRTTTSGDGAVANKDNTRTTSTLPNMV